MLFLGIIVWGMAIGWIAQLILGRTRQGRKNDWLEAIIAGGLGSLVGGTLGSVLMGEGFQLRIGGIAGSVVGAIIVLAIWAFWSSKRS